MERDRIGIGIAFVLTALWAGSLAAALTGRASEWSERLTGTPVLAILGTVLVLGIAANLTLTGRDGGGEG